MAADSPGAWTLVRFTEYLDRWINTESPDQDTRLIVTNWIMTRYDDPYQGVIRERSIPHLWYGRIPQTMDKARTMVLCSYFIFEKAKIVRCDNVGRIGSPF